MRNCRLSSLQATQEYSALAELHRDLHSLLAGAGQVSTEYSKTQYLLQALQNDPAGKYAIEIFLRTFPAIPDRTFEDLVGILILHAPTFIPTTSALGYSNAIAITGTLSAMAAPLDAAGLAQLISKHQKELSAMNKKNGVPRPRSAPKPAGQKYCCIHGYQKSHTGADCNVLKASTLLRSISLPRIIITPLVEINPNVRGWRFGQSVRADKIKSIKLDNTFFNVNEIKIQNIFSSTSALMPVAPI